MSVLSILVWPDPRLSQVCAPVGKVTEAVRKLAADMLDTMYAAEGRGLAGPQVGAMQRIFVMDAGWKAGHPAPQVFLDPVIVAASEGVESGVEGCLSIPGVSAEVERPVEITLAWTDLEGVERRERLTGFDARCAQHEIDHLDGIVTFDRVSAIERAALLAAYLP